MKTREFTTAMEKLKKATDKLRDIVPKPRKGRVSPSIAAVPYSNWNSNIPDSYISPSESSISISPSVSPSVSPSEAYYPIWKPEDIKGMKMVKVRAPVKPQEPLPSLLDRPRRKFKFDEEAS